MKSVALSLVIWSFATLAQAAPVITLTGRDAFMGSTNFGPGGTGTAPPVSLPGDSQSFSGLTPATLTLGGSDQAMSTGPFDSTNLIGAAWAHVQSYSASGSVLAAQGRINVTGGGKGCNVGGCFDFDAGGIHNNRQTLYFSISEDAAFTASGWSGSQQIIDVERWTGSGWEVYRGLFGAWDPFITYNSGLDGAPPVSWSFSNTFLAGDYRIYNKRDFYVGSTDVSWSYAIEFTTPGAVVTAVPEPQALALLLAGLGVVAWRRRGQPYLLPT